MKTIATLRYSFA